MISLGCKALVLCFKSIWQNVLMGFVLIFPFPHLYTCNLFPSWKKITMVVFLTIPILLPVMSSRLLLLCPLTLVFPSAPAVCARSFAVPEPAGSDPACAGSSIPAGQAGSGLGHSTLLCCPLLPPQCHILGHPLPRSTWERCPDVQNCLGTAARSGTRKSELSVTLVASLGRTVAGNPAKWDILSSVFKKECYMIYFLTFEIFLLIQNSEFNLKTKVKAFDFEKWTLIVCNCCFEDLIFHSSRSNRNFQIVFNGPYMHLFNKKFNCILKKII